MRAQLEEARVAPASFVNLSSRFGLVPNVPAPAAAPPSGADLLSAGFGPFFQVGVNATVPLWTFGKLSSAKRAAEAQARVGEWDVEKERQQVRIDVKRAFFGVALARDMLHLASETLGKLDEVIASIQHRLDRGDVSVEETDKLRLQVSRDELVARIADAKRGEAAGTAALRFYTGVQTDFDVLDEPLARPPTPLPPIIEYLAAARTRRADVNRARAGVVARDAQLGSARANLLPNFGLGLRFDWAVAPGVEAPLGGFDPGAANRLQGGAAFGIDWSLDLLSKNARVHQAEANLAEARALEHLALGGSATEVEVAYAAAVEANTRESGWDQAVHRAKGWIASVQDAIDLGNKDERTLVEPLRIFVFARANQLQALMDTLMTRAELTRLSGWEPPRRPGMEALRDDLRRQTGEAGIGATADSPR
jgi:outer membrane protein TolC